MKKNTGKLMGALLILVMLTGMLSLGAAAESAPSGTITVLSFTEYHAAVQAAIDAYTALNPNVTVNLEEYPYAEYNDAVTIKLGSQSQDFDVVMTDATMVSSYAYRGWISSMDAYFTQDEKALFASALVKTGAFEGQFMAPPLCNSCQALFYNKDLLDAAGIAYPSQNPAKRLTWEEIVTMSQQVMESLNDKTIYGLTFEQVDRPYQILPLPNSLGATAFGEDGLTVDGYLNSDNFKKAMQWYSDIHNVANISPKGTTAADSNGLFMAGKIVFLTGNIFNYNTFGKTEGLNWGYTAFPYFADGAAATPTDSWHVGLSSGSQNVPTAVDFIKYFTLGEGNSIFLETRGAFAATISALEKYSSDAKYDEFPLSIFRLASYEAQNTAFPRPSTLAYGEFETIIGSTFSDIRNGVDVTEALDSAVSQLDTQLTMYQ
ncbi:MAG: sugar ABC transporter substrate-binding protein [Clostridiales bacterium]|nr:sugar ABC transporter substrate-binding protein [Clostridiales bacterium]